MPVPINAVGLEDTRLNFFEGDDFEEEWTYSFDTKFNNPDFVVEAIPFPGGNKYKFTPANVRIELLDQDDSNLWIYYGHSRFVGTLAGNAKDQLTDILDGFMPAANGNGNGNGNGNNPQPMNGGRRTPKKHRLHRTKRRRVRRT
jgi:hypothetical protein